jgi:hypothetical protein
MRSTDSTSNRPVLPTRWHYMRALTQFDEASIRSERRVYGRDGTNGRDVLARVLYRSDMRAAVGREGGESTDTHAATRAQPVCLTC